MKQRPLANEPRRSGGQRALDMRAVERDRCLSVTLSRVEVRNLVSTFVPIHRDHDPEERADVWHPAMLATASVGSRKDSRPSAGVAETWHSNSGRSSAENTNAIAWDEALERVLVGDRDATWVLAGHGEQGAQQAP